MRKITITNLQIQFDTFDNGADKFNALDMLDSINEVLQERFPDASPIIFVNAIDDSQIAIEIPEDTREEMINEIIGSMGDNPKYDGSNRAWLESLPDDELQEKYDNLN